jgi:hypothetical protein
METVYVCITSVTKPITYPCPDPDKSSPRSHLISWSFILIVYFHLRVGLQVFSCPSCFPIKIICVRLRSPCLPHAPPVSLEANSRFWNVFFEVFLYYCSVCCCRYERKGVGQYVCVLSCSYNTLRFRSVRLCSCLAVTILCSLGQYVCVPVLQLQFSAV